MKLDQRLSALESRAGLDQEPVVGLVRFLDSDDSTSLDMAVINAVQLNRDDDETEGQFMARIEHAKEAAR